MSRGCGAIGSGMGILLYPALIKICINTLHPVQEETKWRGQLGRVLCVILKTTENRNKILSRSVTEPEQN